MTAEQYLAFVETIKKNQEQFEKEKPKKVLVAKRHMPGNSKRALWESNVVEKIGESTIIRIIVPNNIAKDPLKLPFQQQIPMDEYGRKVGDSSLIGTIGNSTTIRLVPKNIAKDPQMLLVQQQIPMDEYGRKVGDLSLIGTIGNSTTIRLVPNNIAKDPLKLPVQQQIPIDEYGRKVGESSKKIVTNNLKMPMSSVCCINCSNSFQDFSLLLKHLPFCIQFPICPYCEEEFLNHEEMAQHYFVYHGLSASQVD
jgi:hypothetical protein